MEANYFFIDGSALTAQVRQLQRAEPIFRQRKLCPKRLTQYFMDNLLDLHAGSYKRAIFYFPTGDESSVGEYILMPDHRTPGGTRDLNFKFCGHKLKKSAEFDKFVEETVPAKFQSRFAKSEKGIDIEICCDALRLASAGRLERLFLLTNDGDFIPLCRTIKEFGANISIIHLSSVTPPNADLLREADSYDVVSSDSLAGIFVPEAAAPELPLLDEEGSDPQAAGEPESEKPDAEPSDLDVIGGAPEDE